MEQLTFKETLPYSAQDLHDFVMDAQGYKEISPMIESIDVQEPSTNVKEVKTVINVPGLPFLFHYGCILESSPPTEIKATATKSPFKHFSGSLNFRELPNGHTEVSCIVNYKTGFNPLAITAAAVMQSHIDRGIQLAKDYLEMKLTKVEDKSAINNVPDRKLPSVS